MCSQAAANASPQTFSLSRLPFLVDRPKRDACRTKKKGKVGEEDTYLQETAVLQVVLQDDVFASVEDHLDVRRVSGAG
jgi:hypothetical protein